MEHLEIIPILLFSIVIHEVAHGWVANRLGDPTAKAYGRLTLNPIPHIDLFGSIIIPLLSLAAAGSVFIAWAKPVPVNPANFSRPRRDDILVSIAGPASNLLLSLVCTALVIGGAAVARAAGVQEDTTAHQITEFLLEMFYGGVYLNIVLAVFNLIPIPPLDGSHVLASILPPAAAFRYRKFGFMGIVALIFLLRIPQVSEAFQALIAAVASPLIHIIELGT
jgi:Zn-dependent protease